MVGILMVLWRGFIVFAVGLLLPGALCAEALLLAPRGSLFTARAPMFEMAAPSTAPTAQVRAASLFVGDRDRGLFAAMPRDPVGTLSSDPLGLRPSGAMTGDPIAQLRTVIASAEAGGMGYDAVQYGARIKTPKPPTHMTLSEIVAWIRETPGQPHAIGRYQFIPKTLARLVRKVGAEGHMRFSPALQDRLADELLIEAGLHAFRDGVKSRKAFMLNLAKIWAGLPTASGRSYYEGYAGNKATMTYARFDAEMKRIFPG